PPPKHPRLPRPALRLHLLGPLRALQLRHRGAADAARPRVLVEKPRAPLAAPGARAQRTVPGVLLRASGGALHRPDDHRAALALRARATTVADLAVASADPPASARPTDVVHLQPSLGPARQRLELGLPLGLLQGD